MTTNDATNTTTKVLPGMYRGYRVEEGELPDETPATFIFHQGAGVEWVEVTGDAGLRQCHTIIDNWLNAK